MSTKTKNWAAYEQQRVLIKTDGEPYLCHPALKTPTKHPKIPWHPLRILVLSKPPSQAPKNKLPSTHNATLMCCQNNSSHSFLLPAASAKGVASLPMSVPCQALSRTSQPSSALSQENATNWNLIVDAALTVICWGWFLARMTVPSSPQFKMAMWILVLSVSGVFQWLSTVCASILSGPLSNFFFNPGSLLQKD